MSSKRSKRKRYDSCSKTIQIDPASKKHVQNLFQKKFTYIEPEDESWTVDEEKWASDNFQSEDLHLLDELKTLKDNLNNVKEKLSDKDIVSWHQHTKYTHTAGAVIQELKTAYHIELCTQAWCKFYEILNQFPIISENVDEINTVHLCEAPGAFISALNHYLKCKELQDHWKWRATTLNPYHEGNSLNHMIDDDWFIRATLDHWYFGKDGTGNLMNLENIQGLYEAVSFMNGVHLVTADGSIDCQDSPSEQETLVSQLHYYETFTALRLLQPDGCFVIKIFTMFEERTILLLYLLNTTFQQVNVFKPATSKPGNSEVYVICEHYTGYLSPDRFQHIFTTFDNDISSSRPIYPESFLQQHVSCCQQFINYQINAIEYNLSTYQNMDSDQEKWQTSVREYCQELFVTKYNVRRIPDYSHIGFNAFKGKSASFSLDREYEPPITSDEEPLPSIPLQKVNLPKPKHSGSFHDRQKQSNLPWSVQLRQMELYKVFNDRLTLTCNTKLTDEEVKQWSVLTGKKFDKIESSRFCDNKLVCCYNKILDHVSEGKYPPVKYNQLCHILVKQLLNDKVESSKKSTIYCYKAIPMLLDEMKSMPDIETVSLKSLSEMNTLKNETIYCDVVGVGVSEQDHTVKRELLKSVIDVIKYLPAGCSMIIKLGTSLTRFTASILYILSRLFMKTSIKRIATVSYLHQLLYLQVYTGGLDNLVEYLNSVLIDLDRLSSDNIDVTVLEIVPVINVLKDNQFMKFIQHANRNTLAEFINSCVVQQKKLNQPGVEPNQEPCGTDDKPMSDTGPDKQSEVT